MKTVYKYLLTPDGMIDMPLGAEILTVQTQGDHAYVWALVDPKAVKETRYLKIFGTGHRIPEFLSKENYIGTFQLHELVFHVFK